MKKLLACLLILALVPISALASFQAQVYSASMRVYSTNKESSQYYLGSLPKGTTVTVLATSGSWCRLAYAGRTGYALIQDLKSSAKTGAYTTRMVKVYATASNSGRVLDTLTVDFPLYIVGVSGNFYMVQSTDGKATGYVRKNYLSPNKTDIFKVADSEKGTYNSGTSTTTMPNAVKSTQSAVSAGMGKAKYIEYIVYGAQSRLGCKYVSRSANNRSTFTNASFVRSCFSLLGFGVPSDVQQIGHKGTATYVARKDLKRGDIVCFDCEGGDDKLVDHVGIYLGKNYFIHASALAGMIVISEMKSGYYYNAFCWGRRVVG